MKPTRALVVRTALFTWYTATGCIWWFGVTYKVAILHKEKLLSGDLCYVMKRSTYHEKYYGPWSETRPDASKHHCCHFLVVTLLSYILSVADMGTIRSVLALNKSDNDPLFRRNNIQEAYTLQMFSFDLHLETPWCILKSHYQHHHRQWPPSLGYRISNIIFNHCHGLVCWKLVGGYDKNSVLSMSSLKTIMWL